MKIYTTQSNLTFRQQVSIDGREKGKLFRHYPERPLNSFFQRLETAANQLTGNEIIRIDKIQHSGDTLTLGQKSGKSIRVSLHEKKQNITKRLAELSTNRVTA